MSDTTLSFPEEFVWGAASSAYQIEGASKEDGRGESIWDRFSHTSGHVINNETGDVACDHYHRFQEDIDLMVDLNLQAYRFSVSWPRILPSGNGQVNQAGVDFYDRLVDNLLEADIEPFLTLHAWDLPQSLQDHGGWAVRETVDCFEAYARVLVQALGDRVKYWITHNEPWVLSFGGYYHGNLAPGIQNAKVAIQVSHHVLLSHGRAVAGIREICGNNVSVGINLNLSPVYPASNNSRDHDAAFRFDEHLNRWFLDPLFKGSYPEPLFDRYGENQPVIEPGDLQCICSNIDFLGVNYYTRIVVEEDLEDRFLGVKGRAPRGAEYTAAGWEVYPVGLYKILIRLQKDYAVPAVYVTELGSAYEDEVDEHGFVEDVKRLQFLQDHLSQASRAIQDGVNLKGFFVWSFMDLFEWDKGYSQSFGIIRVDRETLIRTIKGSGRWYGKFIPDPVFERLLQ